MRTPEDEAAIRFWKTQLWTARHWTTIRRAGQSQTLEEKGKALSQLLEFFIPAFRAYLLVLQNSFKVSESDAEDYVQGFLADKVLEPGFLAAAENQTGGRFRSFLGTSLRNYCIDRFKERNRDDKRIEEHLRRMKENERLEEQCALVAEREWLDSLLKEAIDRFKHSCLDGRNEHIWRLFMDRYIEPITQDTKSPTDKEFADMYGLTMGQVAGILARGRKQFREACRSVVSNYSETDQDIAEEWNYLCELSRRRPGRLGEILAQVCDDQSVSDSAIGDLATLAVQSDPIESVAIDISGGKTDYCTLITDFKITVLEGATVNVSAPAVAGDSSEFEFVRWRDKNGNTIASTSGYTFAITQDQILVAEYRKL